MSGGHDTISGLVELQMLDMPTADLGAPAYRKIDFEVLPRGLL